MPYVRRVKSGRLEYRRAFPNELRAHLGRRELIVSLGAKSLAEPGAMQRYNAANEDYERLVATVRRAVSGSFDELDRARMAWVLETHEVEFLTADDAARVADKSNSEDHDAADSGWTGILEQGDMTYIRTMFEDEAVALAARQGWVLDVSSREFSTLCLELLRTTVRANRLRMERDNGHPVPTPVAAAPPPSPAPDVACVGGISFDALVREQMERPTFAATASTKQSWNTALRYLREVRGEPTPQEITRRQVSDFADILAVAPVKRAVPQSQRGWALPKLVDAHAERDVERISRKTRAAIIGALQAAWNRCQQSGRIADELANPFARPNLGKAPTPRKNDGLTPEELKAIFSLPVFTAGERPAGGRGEARFWLPVLLLTTGARPEELAQAVVGDVRHDAESQGLSLTITALGEHPHKGQRRLKTASAERIIPLPSIAIDLGFADYVDWLRRGGELALFPALRAKGERGDLFASFRCA